MPTDYFDLRDMNAMVTGAATGIGLAIAIRLANAGAQVAICDLDERAAAQAARHSERLFAQSMDISNSESVAQAFDEFMSRCGRIDILVNNAGVAGRAAPLWEQSAAEFERVIQVNLLCARM